MAAGLLAPRLGRKCLQLGADKVFDKSNEIDGLISYCARLASGEDTGSGFGTLRRNPDLKWRHAASAIDELATKQRGILRAAARLVKPGGRLVYATCSILREENEAIADEFAATHNDFRPASCMALLAAQKITLDTGENLRLWPHLHATDGFFAAAFERSS